MTRDDYILRSLSKISKKRLEHYAINRIYHRLNDREIEFVCQQCVRKNDEKIYLADLFFPQLKVYLEIDEGHHDGDGARIRDAVRRFDIAESAGLMEERIQASNVKLDEFDKLVDGFVEKIKELKADLLARGEFPVWNYEKRFTAEPHLEAGFIELGPYSVFRTHKDALNCFGYGKGHIQKAVWSVPSHIRDAIGLSGKCMVWFPKLYEHANWKNSLSEDGMVISEMNKNAEHVYTEPWDQRIVMARSRDELNRTLYRFLGVFEVIPAYRSGNEHRFRRIATSVKTCRPTNL